MRSDPKVRKGQAQFPLSREEFEARFFARFSDPAFAQRQAAIRELADIGWDAYSAARKSPITRKAGAEFADPDYDLSVDWLAARAGIHEAQKRYGDPAARSRILLICGAARNDKTCPGEMSKSFRLTQTAKAAFDEANFDVDVLDLSALTSEYGKVIYPCKGCVSTAMPLCHWPCSCYPNHGLGQVTDWMNELYPRWVAAHGIMIITPVYWYQAPSVLKLMIDRLVCADGGNPDPTTTHGKKAEEAKALEIKGWSYPRHLAGRSYALVVHGDSAGTETLRRSLSDWLNDMRLVQAGAESCIDRFIDYYRPYATSHDALDKDEPFHEEVRNAARSLSVHVTQRRQGQKAPDESLSDPRPK
ncbi:MAG TPA: NAD(P)H-dependent oxidoreductase [Steroidobacteraceae bacterium]|jgi:multimeric flavodoxin WrbA|nr:NAD(P)H-dependent oxidoreductase [Steroidobacteraceae bacterium]